MTYKDDIIAVTGGYGGMATAFLDAVLVADSSGCVLEVDDFAEQMFGCDPEDLVGIHVRELLVNTNVTQRDVWPLSASGSAVQRWQINRGRGAGRLVDVQIRRLGRGESVKFVVALRGADSGETACERDQQGEDQRAQRARDAQKFESLGLLAAGIAHDFNNFLTGILGYAEILISELPKQSPHRKDLQIIRTSATRAAALCKQLLAYAGKDRLSTSVFDLPTIIREMGQLLDVAISKSVVVEYDFAAKLSPIEGDEVQIRQLVMNLMTNASEAMASGTGVMTVSVREVMVDAEHLIKEGIAEPLSQGRYVLFSVSDSGCGMDEATMARIFDPFFTTKLMGRGLGLSAVMSIVRRHRGHLQISSEVGRGSVFRVWLPASAEHARPSQMPPAPMQQWSGSGTILVVDDENDVCSLTTRILERHGFYVLTAAHGRQAIKVFQQTNGIVLVLLDMMMPHLDGVETFQELRRINRSVPIVMMSGYGEQGVIDWFDASEPLQFIQKPFSTSDLIDKVRTALAVQEN